MAASAICPIILRSTRPVTVRIWRALSILTRAAGACAATIANGDGARPVRTIAGDVDPVAVVSAPRAGGLPRPAGPEVGCSQPSSLAPSTAATRVRFARSAHDAGPAALTTVWQVGGVRRMRWPPGGVALWCCWRAGTLCLQCAGDFMGGGDVESERRTFEAAAEGCLSFSFRPGAQVGHRRSAGPASATPCAVARRLRFGPDQSVTTSRTAPAMVELFRESGLCPGDRRCSWLDAGPRHKAAGQ
jgi:hypothetical protein